MKAHEVSLGCNIKDPSNLLRFTLNDVLGGIGHERMVEFVEPYCHFAVKVHQQFAN